MIQYGCIRKATCCPSYSGRHILKRRITMYLEKINSPSDIKKLSIDEKAGVTNSIAQKLNALTRSNAQTAAQINDVVEKFD